MISGYMVYGAWKVAYLGVTVRILGTSMYARCILAAYRLVGLESGVGLRIVLRIMTVVGTGGIMSLVEHCELTGLSRLVMAKYATLCFPKRGIADKIDTEGC